MDERPIAMPTADEAARAVIAACLVNQDVAERATELLTPDDFRDVGVLSDYYAPVFEAIASLVKAGKRSVPVLVAREMDRLGIAPKMNGSIANYLSETMRNYTPGVNADAYCNIMAEYGYRRRLRLAGMKWMDLSQQMSLSVDDLASEKEKIAAEVEVRSTSDKPKKLGDVIREQLEVQRNRKKGEILGLRTGFPAVDAMWMGMNPGDFIIIAARPSMGKTALAEEIASNVAKRGGSVGIVSAEMPDEQLAKRSIASEGGVSGELMRAGMVDERHWDQVAQRLQESGLLDAKLFVVDNINTVPQSRRWAFSIKKHYGLDLLIFDYLQLMKPGDRYRGNRVQEVGEISHSLKALAKELGIPIIALSQLSRTLEGRSEKEGGKRPMLSDLRETGDIEQDADLVAFIYRDEYYHPDTSDKGVAEIITAKHRNGPTGTAKLGFIKERTKFVSLEKRNG